MTKNDMKQYKIEKKDKSKIISILQNTLQNQNNIIFAYLHGSFVSELSFNDIDIAVYLNDIPYSIIDFELQCELHLMKAIGKYIVDVRVLNKAPLPFKYHVIKNGILLLSHDDDARTLFHEKTILEYLDFLPHIKNYMKEILDV